MSMDSEALAAARLLAEHRLPGIVVTDADQVPRAVLPASQVVRFLVPGYVQDDPSLAGVLSESVADRIAEALQGKTVGQLLRCQSGAGTEFVDPGPLRSKPVVE